MSFMGNLPPCCRIAICFYDLETIAENHLEMLFFLLVMLSLSCFIIRQSTLNAFHKHTGLLSSLMVAQFGYLVVLTLVCFTITTTQLHYNVVAGPAVRKDVASFQRLLMT